MRTQQVERETERVKERIEQAKASGRISSTQADILAKKADELKDFKVRLLKMSVADRHAAREKKEQELAEWLSENKIEEDYLKRIL